MRIIAPFIFVLGLSFLTTTAFAQYVDRDDSVRFEDDFESDEFVIAGRFRGIGMPSFIWDFWFDEHPNHWSDGQLNFSFGGEFTWRREGSFEIGFAVDYADLSMKDAFWLESGKSAVDQDWTQFDVQLLSLVFFTQWFWDVKPWFSPFVGVGLGPGLVLGDVTEFNPKEGSTCRNEALGGVFASPSCLDKGKVNLERDFDAGEKETGIPPLLPVLQLGGGVRFNIAKHAMLKIELGFQDYLYLGGALGVQW